jgi:hypothetical protein
MTEDTLEAILQDLKEAVSEPKTPFNVRQAVKRLEEFLEAPDDENCPDCGGSIQPPPRITQVIPAAEGWRAVFAEGDSKDPLSMSVESVMFFGVVEFPDGFSIVSGLYINNDDAAIVPCWPMMTFVGYVPPGKNPDILADKVREKIKELRDMEEHSKD